MNGYQTSHRIHGVRVIESIYLTDTRVDVSGCRSPSRALRRWHLRGIRGRIVITKTPKPDAYQLQDGSLVIHPETLKRLRKRLAEDIDRRILDQLGGLGL